jgi:hypothetical protein
MSKPPCGLWHGTAGELAFYGDAEVVIAKRVEGLDLREHPTGRKQLSDAGRRAIAKKIANRTATREEYKRYEWDARLAKRRNNGVRLFWEAERDRLEAGDRGTRNWSTEQREAILNSKRPKYNGKTLQAHHAYSVSRYPHLANVAAVLYPATPLEHLKGWHGGSYRKSLPGRRIRKINEF